VAGVLISSPAAAAAHPLALGAVLHCASVVTIDNDEISNNQVGVDVVMGTALLSRSAITNNSGITNEGTVDTYQDNRINANGNAVNDNALAAVSPQ
jgi:hypothetical protein